MLCYRDMTFCHFYKECKEGETCQRALTKDVENAAVAWWGGKDAPIAQYVDKPKCFIILEG